MDTVSPFVPSFVTPYEESGAEAYIPLQVASKYIEKIVGDMKKMKNNHYKGKLGRILSNS